MATNKDYPRLDLDNQRLRIQLKPASSVRRSVTARLVLDFNYLGQVIAIEILYLKSILGMNCLDNFAEDIAGGSVSLRYSYDQDCDAFSLELNAEDSSDQHAVDGHILLDDEGHIIGFDASVLDEQEG